MKQNNYSEKLKDPRWQKRRLEILQRDEFTCRYCWDDTSTLHVHHTAYTGDPWEAPDTALYTLCENCHEQETSQIKEAINNAVESLKKAGFGVRSFNRLANIFSDTDRKWFTQEPYIDVLKMVVDDEELWDDMWEIFRDRLAIQYQKFKAAQKT